MLKYLLSILALVTLILGYTCTSYGSPNSNQIAASEPKIIKDLTINRSIDDQISNPEIHIYQVKLLAGQFLAAQLTQMGGNLKVTLYAADGKKLMELDTPDRRYGLETIYYMAETEGDYRLEISSLEAPNKKFNYQFKITQIGAPASRDKEQLQGQQDFLEAVKLRQKQQQADLKEAIKRLASALQHWQIADNNERMAEAHNLMGRICLALGDNEKALEYFEPALKLFRQTGGKGGEANVLNNMSIAYQYLNQNKKTFELSSISLGIAKELGDNFSSLAALNSIGFYYKYICEYRKALDYYDQVLELNKSLSIARIDAISKLNIGEIYGLMGEHTKSLQFNEESLAISTKIKDEQLQGYAKSALAAEYTYIYEFQRSIDYANEAIAILRKFGDNRGLIIALTNMGGIYNNLGDTQRAIGYLNEVLPLAKEKKNIQIVARAISKLAEIHLTLQEPTKAIEYLQSSLSLFQEIKDRDGESVALRSLAIAYTQLKDAEKALDYYNRSLLLKQQLEDIYGEASILVSQGKYLITLAQNSNAINILNRSLNIAETNKYPGIKAEALYGLAQINRNNGDLITAYNQMKQVITIIESIRSKILSAQTRTIFLSKTINYYDLFIEILMELHKKYPQEDYQFQALQINERAIARRLLEILVETHANIRQGVDEQLIAQERSLQQQIDARYEILLKIKKDSDTANQIQGIEKEIAELNNQLDMISNKIKTTSPAYANLIQPAPISLKEIQQQVLNDDTVLLEYKLGSKQSYLWFVNKNEINSYELPARKDIEDEVLKLRSALTARSCQLAHETEDERQERINKAEKQLEYSAIVLGKILLAPVATKLGNKRLIIVADGALNLIPFGVLQSPVSEELNKAANRSSNYYLPIINLKELASLPSASTLLIARQEYNQRKNADNLIAIFADPVFDINDDRVKLNKNSAANTKKSLQDKDLNKSLAALRSTDCANRSELQFERLLGTREEALKILKFTLPKQVLQATDFQANLENATGDKIANYQMLHFATHSIVPEDSPESAGIVLSLINEQSEPQNGYLRLPKIYNLKLSAELVTLSACETGIGKEIKGEGLVTLSRGFMYAGAKRVVASLWKIDDAATTIFMTQFYRSMLKDHLTPTAALRKAQLHMISLPQYRSPFYWAAFILQGEYN